MSLDGADQANGAQFAGTGVGEGCGLWLSISATNDTSVLLTLHNTRTGQSYTVWSSEDISITLTNWSVETNLTGASGDFTETIIAMGQRSNLFLRASENRDYVTNSVFQGLGYTNTRAVVADTMGAVGPNHFVELLNGVTTNAAIAVYDKSGMLISQASMSNFFAVAVAGTNYPTEAMSDPRILYDHQSQHWVASAIQQSLGIVILAVSNDDSPTNLASGWVKYVFQVRTNASDPPVDYDTLGMDANGIYFSVLRTPLGTNVWHSVVAIKKPEIYQGTNLSTQLNLTNASWTIQPAVNFDAVPTNGYAWFVAKGPPDAGTNYQGGAVLYRRLQWQGTNAAWADTNWIELSNSGPTYQDYYEPSGTNFSSYPTAGVSAPQLGTTNGINLYGVGSRLMMATIRNGFVWTCHTVGLSGTNGTYIGDSSGTNVDRSAVQWFKLEISPDSTTLTLSDYGRVFDPAETNAWWYYFPSLAVNCAGDMVVGFSGSSPTNYIGAMYTWRLADGSMLGQPRLIQSGTITSTALRLGDYSATTLDPTDDWSFWTVQEYATPFQGPHGSVLGQWGTVVAKIRPNP